MTGYNGQFQWDVMCPIVTLHRKVTNENTRVQTAKYHVATYTDIKAVHKHLLASNSKALVMCFSFFYTDTLHS